MKKVSLHLQRVNPLAKAVTQDPTPVMLIVSLCDAYVSPKWYEMDNQVPTWLYGAVHLHGTLHALDDASLEPLLIDLSDKFEQRLHPQKTWSFSKVSDKVKTGLMRAIQPFGFTIDRVEATDKFAQTKPAAALKSLASAVQSHSFVFGAHVDLVVERVRCHAHQKSS